MPASTDNLIVPRAQCRQILRSDLGTLASILETGFPGHAPGYWENGLARIAARPIIADMPHIGYTLEACSGLVGVIFTISSRRGQQVICNLSSWYVEQDYRRGHAKSLPIMATSAEGAIYLNTSPANHTRKTMSSLGWIQYNFGRSVAFPVLTIGAGKVSENSPASLPERTLLEDHRALGCISVVCVKGGTVSPFVFRPRRVTRLKLPIMELIYCRDTSEFERCGAALGRYFLARGSLGFILDGKVKHMPSIYAEEKEPRLYKGPHPPKLNDLAYTEKVIFG
jgi:hypothetical protein